MAGGWAASLSTGLVSCGAPSRRPAAAPSPRELTGPEAERLASMRLQNHREGRAGLRATIGTGDAEVTYTGWVDWQRPLVYLAVTGRNPGPADGLVQAVPGVIALRPGRMSDGRPPAEPPVDGWRVRLFGSTGPDGSPLDGFLALLFALASDRVDSADRLSKGEARWVRRDRAGDVPVDVVFGPAVPPTPGPDVVGPKVSPSATHLPAFADQGGAVLYWLDGTGRLLRLDANVANNLPLRADFARDDRPELAAIDAFGGKPVRPRPVTKAEATTLARLYQRNRAARGGAVTIVLPAAGAELLRAEGWVDWRTGVAYLSLRDQAKPEDRMLLRADGSGVAHRAVTAKSADGRPPVPAPRGDWKRTDWSQRGDAGGVSDLDLLVAEVLAVGGPGRDLGGTAIWLRADVLGGVPVTVYEQPLPAERGILPGLARLRYWIDDSGMLRRIEVRTRLGAFGQLDLHPGTVPKLPSLTDLSR